MQGVDEDALAEVVFETLVVEQPVNNVKPIPRTVARKNRACNVP
jgi:hypothetical protein